MNVKRIESIEDAKAWLGQDHYLLKVHAEGHLRNVDLVNLSCAIQSAHIALSRSICAVQSDDFIIPRQEN